MMNFFAQNRTATIVIIILIALNLFSIYFFVFHKRIAHRQHHERDGFSKHERQRDRSKMPDHGHFITKELGFSEEQAREYQKMRKELFERMGNNRKEQKELRELMFKNLGNAAFNIDSVAQRISQRQMETETAMFHHFKSIQALCTDEQKAKFDQTIKKIMRKMGEHWSKQKRERPMDN